MTPAEFTAAIADAQRRVAALEKRIEALSDPRALITSWLSSEAGNKAFSDAVKPEAIAVARTICKASILQ